MRRFVPAVLLLAATGFAQKKLDSREVPRDRAAQAEAAEFRKLVVEGRETREGLKRVLKELRWYSTLSGMRTAASAKGRPVFLIQALGQLRGYC